MRTDWTTSLGFDRWTAASAAALGPSSLLWAFDPEAAATLREALLMPYDLAPVIPRAQAGEDVVVLLHGFMATAGVFRPMRARLERECGVHVASFTHAPGAGVRRIAAQLRDLVDRLHPHARVHVVGHSLGGLVARWYVQEMGGYRRVAQTISLGSPFQGARFARRLPFLVGADLHGQSSLLERIRAGAHKGGVPHTSIVGEADRLVFPSDSARFPLGDVHVIAGCGHNTLLYREDVAALIVGKLRKVARAAA
jgi:pimeloyl-ACP methyl ester carboxylesterase